MSDLDPQQGRASEELPRLLALEPWLRGARVVWLGPASEDAVEWLHRLGASRVSLVGSNVSKGLRADVYLESDGLGAVPSGRSDVVIVDDMAARLVEDPELLRDLQRLLAPEGCVFGILPADGDHVGVDMLSHRAEAERLHYADVVEQLEARFAFVTAVAQVPLLGYLVTGTDADAKLRFDGRIADLGREPPLYHIVGGFETEPEATANRIATLSFDKLSDRVGRVVARLTEEAQATRLEATRCVATMEASLSAVNAQLARAEEAADTEAQAHASAERQRLVLHEQLRKAESELEAAEKARHAARQHADEAMANNEKLQAQLRAAEAVQQQLQQVEAQLAAAEEARDHRRSQAEEAISIGEALRQRLEEQGRRLDSVQEAMADAASRIETLSAQLEAAHHALESTHQTSESVATERQHWQARAERAMAWALRLDDARTAADDALRTERRARSNDPLAQQLAEARVAQQRSMAAAYRLGKQCESRAQEMLDMDQRLRRAMAEARHRDHLLTETQDRLERATAERDHQAQMPLLDHLKKQLAEALNQEEALDEERATLQRHAVEAEARVQALVERLSEFEALKPRLDEVEDDRKRLKTMLDETRQQAEVLRQRDERSQEELIAAQQGQDVLKDQAVELAEAVSNLTARIDLLEGEANARLENIDALTAERTQLERRLADERVLTKSLRSQLEEAQNRPPEDDSDLSETVTSLQQALESSQAQHHATLAALQQSGVEKAALERDRRQLELENQRLRAAVAAKRAEPTHRVAELQDRLQRRDDECERLEAELASYRARADQAADQARRLAALEAEAAELSSSKRTLSDEVERLAPFEPRVAELEGELSDLDRAGTEQQREVEALRTELSTVADALQALRHASDAAKAEANEAAIAAKHSFEQHSAGLNAALAAAERTATDQINRNDELERQLHRTKAELLNRTEALQSLQERLDEAQNLQQVLSEAQAQSERSSDASHRQLQAQADEAQRQLLAQAAAAERNLRDETTTLQAALEISRSDLEALRQDKRALEGELGEAQEARTTAERNLAAAEAALAELRSEHARRLEAIEQRHADTLRSSLSRAADVQQAELRALNEQLNTLSERAANVAAQEDRIVALVEEQRKASDQAWDLAIAERTARFASLLDRFHEAMRASGHIEGP